MVVAYMFHIWGDQDTSQTEVANLGKKSFPDVNPEIKFQTSFSLCHEMLGFLGNYPFEMCYTEKCAFWLILLKSDLDEKILWLAEASRYSHA